MYRDDLGRTALHWAAVLGLSQQASLLVDAGQAAAGMGVCSRCQLAVLASTDRGAVLAEQAAQAAADAAGAENGIGNGVSQPSPLSQLQVILMRLGG